MEQTPRRASPHAAASPHATTRPDGIASDSGGSSAAGSVGTAPSRSISLALQGGGAHGAFTWGVLDRLLEEPDLHIAAISGSSAGALNGAALAAGLAAGGPTEAKANLQRLWEHVTQAGLLMSLLHLPIKKPGLGVWDEAMPLLSPYMTNPLSLEPLRYALTMAIDVDRLRDPAAPPLFVNAVNVNTGQSRVFGPDEQSIATLMASACAPMIFPAVQIDGQSYWDGSYGGNPMLWPLYDGQEQAVDILMVELTPLQRAETPTSAKDILSRINEIASINGLVAELRALDCACRDGRRAPVRLHMLSFPDAASAADLEPSTKRTVGPLLYSSLRSRGHAACDGWLARHGSDIGLRSSMAVDDRFLGPYTLGGTSRSAVPSAPV